MKFYCTKYWSTAGIVEFEGVVYEEVYASEERTAGKLDHMFLRIGTDAFTTLDAAREDVEKRAHSNLHSKEKALKKAKWLLQMAAERKIKVVAR